MFYSECCCVCTLRPNCSSESPVSLFVWMIYVILLASPTTSQPLLEIFPPSLNLWLLRYIKYCLAQMIYMAKIFFLLAFGAEQFLKIPLWWKQKEAGIKWKKERSRGGGGMWNDGSQLWQIAFNLKTIQERFWYSFQSQARVLWGVLSALSETNLEPLGHSDRKGKGFQARCPKPLLPCLLLPLSLSLSLSLSPT